MLIDFHYYTIKVLCSYAGMTDSQAQTVAYASQYVDDSVDYRKIFLSKPLRRSQYARYNTTDLSFDPICTAHKGLSMIRGISSEAQLKVFIPFHFIPSEEYMCQETYNYRTAAGSNFAYDLLAWAFDPASHELTDRALIKAGIALHTFADTWSHHNFSGRYNQTDNNIDAIWIDKNGTWYRVTPIKVALGNLAPDIGHIEAFKYPDLSHLKWKYNGSRGEVVRDNSLLFMDAAEAINNYLVQILGHPNRWSEYRDQLEQCFRFTDGKASKFEEVFPQIRFDYDAKDWRNEAIAQDEEIKDRHSPLDGKKWFKFHEEAYEQRLFVMNRILLF